MARLFGQRSRIIWAAMLVVAAVAVFANASGDDVGLGDDHAAIVNGYEVELPVEIRWTGDYACQIAGGELELDGPACALDALASASAPGTRDSAVRTTMVVDDASASEKWSVRLLVAVLSVSIIGAALALARVFESTAVFDSATAVWLRVCAVFVAIGGLFVPWLNGVFEERLISSHTEAAKSVSVSPADAGVALMPLVVVVALLALAEVWRRGVRLREDAEATI